MKGESVYEVQKNLDNLEEKLSGYKSRNDFEKDMGKALGPLLKDIGSYKPNNQESVYLDSEVNGDYGVVDEISIHLGDMYKELSPEEKLCPNLCKLGDEYQTLVSESRMSEGKNGLLNVIWNAEKIAEKYERLNK